MKILLIDNYDSFTYNLYHYFSSLGCSVEVFRNDKISIKQIETQIEAINRNGGKAAMRIVDGAHHSFDRYEPVHHMPEARVAPEAPILFL